MCGFSLPPPHAPYLFSDFALYPFAILNNSQECDRTLTLCDHKQITEPEGGLRDLQLSCYLFFHSSRLYEKMENIEFYIMRPT